MAQIGLASTDTRLNRATPAELEKGDNVLCTLFTGPLSNIY
jgi:hypothetical protein